MSFNTAIHCCIVEEHCDIVPFIHALMRAKRLPLTDILLIHIDAHPDLVPISEPFFFRDLSDTEAYSNALDRDGGIAEFILPLVYNGHISEILWVRSSWSQQIRDGSYEFKIGDSTTRAGVTLKSSYYYDDGVVFDEKDLEPGARSLRLGVCLSTENAAGVSFLDKHKDLWILDICLDYFSTLNPFYLELEDILSSNGIEKTNILHIEEFYNYLCYKKETSGIDLSTKQRRTARDSWMKEINFLFDQESTSKEDIGTLLQLYFERNVSTEGIINTFCDILWALNIECRRRVIEIGHLISLPHHRSSQEEILLDIANLKLFLLERKNLGNPSAITIARSSRYDEYTPTEQVSPLLL